MSEEAKEQMFEMVFVGWRRSADSKIDPYWQEIQDGEPVGQGRTWAKYRKNASVGSIYDFQGSRLENGGLSIYYSGTKAPVFNRMHTNRAQIVEWEVESRKAQNVKAQQDKAKKVSSALFAGLDPIKEAYHATNYEGRAALIALVIQYIMKG